MKKLLNTPYRGYVIYHWRHTEQECIQHHVGLDVFQIMKPSLEMVIGSGIYATIEQAKAWVDEHLDTDAP